MNAIRVGAIMLLIGLDYSAAHVGDRLYPIFYLTDEMMEGIRVDDGTVDEWYELVGEPNLSILDFHETQNNSQYDPSDMDFRIWLAWHDDPVRIYLAFVGSDDAYENNHDYDANFPQNLIIAHDSIELIVDGDHSGGPGYKTNTDPTEEESLEWS